MHKKTDYSQQFLLAFSIYLVAGIGFFAALHFGKGKEKKKQKMLSGIFYPSLKIKNHYSFYKHKKTS
ncbi:hypothetical protein PI23P_05932 [Polaribacter irgensii 23-P]|uniref:Uncharacterized protein n=1 Tax=Polaribacter irgensii 23-P TaxID=313594 RepID=A4BYH3_9FLAO|nr:hypothetical protein PI23P_05932 [Polaribacter irgensii 23-P]